MRVEKLGKWVLECSILGGAHHRETVLIPRIPLSCSNGLMEGLEFVRKQFSIRLAFAMTINKAQGQSLDCVGLLLEREVFSHGQLYVALSRATSPDAIRIVLPDAEDTKYGRVRNIVWPEALR